MVKVGKKVLVLWIEWCRSVSSNKNGPYRAGGSWTIADLKQCPLYCRLSCWFENFTIIIGAANRESLKKEKCGKQLAAPRLFSWMSPIHSGGENGNRYIYIFCKMAATLKYKWSRSPQLQTHYPTLATIPNPVNSLKNKNLKQLKEFQRNEH